MAEFEPIKLGILGCGAVIQTYHSDALLMLERSEVYAVKALSDTSDSAVQAVQKHFPAAKCSSNLKALLDEDLDLVLIATPPVFHADQTISLLRSGKSVLCEKPMAVSVAQARDMLKEAEQHNRTLAIGMIRRFIPFASQVFELIHSDEFGGILSWSITEGTTFNWPSKSSAVFQKSLAGGGVLIDTGTHILDLVQHWFGQPSSVRYEDDAADGVETNCRLHLNYEAGFHGTIRLSRDTDMQNETVIVGGKKTIRIANNILLDETNATPQNKPEPFTQQDVTRIFANQLTNVARAVRGLGPLTVSPRDCVNVVELIENCYRTRSMLEQPWLTASERAAMEILR
jgi:predicted dehydrogenase